MANSVYQSLTFTASDDADETTILGRLTSINTAGRSVSYYDKKTFKLVASASAINIMPTGTPTLANGSLQVFVKTYLRCKRIKASNI